MKFDNKKSILFIRSIGGIIIGLIIIDTIFFKHNYICKTFIGSGLSAGIASIMVQYKIDESKKSFKKRLLSILLILIVSSILFFFWYK